MALNSYLKTNVQGTGTTALSGAAPQTGAGNELSMVAKRVALGSLSALVYAQATTNTLTITGKWQVRANASGTWRDCFPSNNAAQVTIVTGTGSAVNSTRCVEAPDGVYGWPFVRYVVTTGVASAGAGDEFSIAYNYRQEC
jgi:hypothetical protein